MMEVYIHLNVKPGELKPETAKALAEMIRIAQETYGNKGGNGDAGNKPSRN